MCLNTSKLKKKNHKVLPFFLTRKAGYHIYFIYASSASVYTYVEYSTIYAEIQENRNTNIKAMDHYVVNKNLKVAQGTEEKRKGIYIK